MNAELDRLEIRVASDSQDAAAKLDRLVSSLAQLKPAAKGGGGLAPVARGITQLNTALSQLNTNKKKLGDLKSALSGLSGVKVSLSPVANQINKVGAAINNIKVDDAKLRELVSAVNTLGQIQKPVGLSSAVTALQKLPQITKSLSSSELRKFGLQMQLVTKYVAPLATEMQKVANGFAAFPIRIQRIIQSNQGLSASNRSAARSFSFFDDPVASAIAVFHAYEYAIRRVVGFLADSITSINEYVENVNLFQVSMGEFYDEAFAYAQLVNDKLGIDPSQWMRTQGVFMSIATGFGVARDQAYALSEGLTELAYDLSSLYNEDMESSALRLQSALAGEIEPIRRLGIAISEASLKEFALARGIDKSVESMTEQEKALLRTLKLMEGAANIGAIGDFARTLESPANALRVLNQQITQLQRAIGSVLLPAVVQLLPYVQAVVELLAEAISELAVFVGFTMPEWDANDWASGVAGATEEIEDATAAAKELKDAVLGIDELNVISPDTGSSASSATGAGSGADWAAGLEIPDIWDQNALAGIRTQVDDLKESMRPLLDTAVDIGIALLGWKLSASLVPSVTNLPAVVKAVKAQLKTALGGMLVGVGISILIDNIADIKLGEYDNASLTSLLHTLVGGVLSGIGLVLLTGTGWVFPVAIVLSFAITDIVVNWDRIGGMWGNIADGIVRLVSGDVPGMLDSISSAYLTWMEGDSWGLEISKFVANAVFGEGTWEKALDLLKNGGGFRGALEYASKRILGAFSEAGQQAQNFFPGVWDGVKGALEGVVGGFLGIVESILNGIIGKVNSFLSSVNTIASAISGFLGLGWTNLTLMQKIDFDDFSLSLESTTPNILNKPNSGQLPAYAFADGGFPETGRLFISDEAGPELVGTIGRQTAVANTQQIVQGIASGVSQANTTQNELLREQNELLRAILAKDGATYLDGKRILKSVETAARNTGVMIMAGGVV